MKFIRVDCDYYAEGLWDERGAMISADRLPVSQTLRERIKAWNAWFTEEADPVDQTCPYDWELHRLTAVDIARCLVRQMPGHIVVAVDRRVGPDEHVRERVPYPGEDGGAAFLRWRESFASGTD